MTDLEDRVRAALLARAGEFTASPDAWERTVARAGRRTIRRQAPRPARQRWQTRFTPLAAAAAVIVIGAGSAALAEAGGFSGVLRHVGLGPDGNTAPPSAHPSLGTAVGAPCAFPDLSATVPVVGVPISAKVTLDGVTTWWTRVPEGTFSVDGAPVKTNLALCQVLPDGDMGGDTLPLDKGQLVQASTPITGASTGSSVNGIAVASVTSVQAVLANGHVVRGDVAYGRGFPYAAWWIGYPQGISATLVFRDAAGQVVKEIAAPYPVASALRHPLPIPSYAIEDNPCMQARVQQVMDGIKVWTWVGVASHPLPATPGRPARALCETTGVIGAEVDYEGGYTLPAGQAAQRVFVLNPTQSVSGIAARGVTSVTAVLADGREYTGTFVTGKVFAYPVWIVSYPLKDPATLVFRDAAGAQVAVLHEPANP